MNKLSYKRLPLVFGVVVLIATMLLLSCNDKVNLIGDGRERAIVYGVLDPAETTHLVKITRSFIGDGMESATDIAKIADSSYFKKVNVKIEEILSNSQIGRVFALHDTIVKNKQVSGTFYAPNQKMYVFYTTPDQPLLEDATYRLSIDIDEGRLKITGQTSIVSGITLGNWSNVYVGFRMTRSGNELGQYASQVINIPNVGTAYRMNAKIRFDYQEFAAGSGEITDKSILFDLGESKINSGFNASQSFSFHGETFYERLKQQIPPINASIDKRIHKGFEIQISGASSELTNYMEVSKPSSSLAQNKPKYTNLSITSGYEVIGIFAARTTKILYKHATAINENVQALDRKSRQELCVGPLTATLGFCSDHPVDNKLNNPASWRCQ